MLIGIAWKDWLVAIIILLVPTVAFVLGRMSGYDAGFTAGMIYAIQTRVFRLVQEDENAQDVADTV